MPTKLSRAGFFSFLASLSPTIFASPQVVECPTSIAKTSIQLTNTEAGWTPFIASPLYLHAAAPMYGPPELRGELADFSTRPGKTEWSYTYGLDGEFVEGKWIQCAYGAFNEVTLSKRIDDNTKECTFTYRNGKKAAQHEIKIQCK